MIKPVIPAAGIVFEKPTRQKLYVTDEAVESARHFQNQMIPLNGQKLVDSGYARTIALQAQMVDPELRVFFTPQRKKPQTSASGNKSYSTQGPVFLCYGKPQNRPLGVRKVTPALAPTTAKAKAEKKSELVDHLLASKAESKANKIAELEAMLAEARAN